MAVQFGVVLFELCTGSHPARWRQEFNGGPLQPCNLLAPCHLKHKKFKPSASFQHNTEVVDPYPLAVQVIDTGDWIEFSMHLQTCIVIGRS